MRVIGGPSHCGGLSGKFMHFNRSKRLAFLNLEAALHFHDVPGHHPARAASLPRTAQ